MADQHNDNIPALSNQISGDIPDIKENLEYHKDVFQNFCTTWSNTDATGIFPSKIKWVSKTADYTVTAADVMLAVDASSAAVTITLEAAATAGAGREVMIKCIDATNSVTITPDGTETIDGAATYTLDQQYEAVWLVSNGSNWDLVSHYQKTLQVADGGTGLPSSPITVPLGGTGLTSLTDHSLLVGSGTDAITPLTAMTDGQIVVGATGADPAPQTVSGDATLASDGTLTIADGAVTEAKLASNLWVKGWINFNGTGTIAIRDSYNVSSITDLGTGNYKITWDTDFANSSYAATISCSKNTGGYNMVGIIETVAVDYISIYTVISSPSTGSTQDPTTVCVIAIGDQ